MVAHLDRSHALIPVALGHAACLLALVALLVQLLRGPRWERAAWAMAIALCVSAVWSVCGIAYALAPGPMRWNAVRWSELLRGAVWPLFILVLLHERPAEQVQIARRSRFAAFTAMALLVMVVVGGLVPPAEPGVAVSAAGASRLGLLASLGLSVAGMVSIEQLLRNV